MAEENALAETSRGPRLYGVIDVLRPDRVAGWVIDRTDAARCATVEIRREGRLIGTAAANRPRKDLERQELGTGSYGFAFAFEPPLEEGMEFTVAVNARSHDGVCVPLQPAAAAARSVSAEKRVLGRLLSATADLKADLEALRQAVSASEEGHAEQWQRLELVQLRLESAIAAFDTPPQGPPRWLSAVAILGAAIALVSLGVAALSMWMP